MSVKTRSDALTKTRNFFLSKGYLEVDVPAWNEAASVDAYIDLMEVEGGYLHSSPELRMKDLLCNGSGDIFFLGHVFRKEEEGSRHKEEFTMLEYYKTNTTEKAFVEEVIEFLSLFLGKRKTETLTYDEALEKYTPKKLPPEITTYTEEEKRHYLFGHFVEPSLGKECFSILTDFPAEEASLAKTALVNGKEVAKRFEIFVDGYELGNGFDELSCAKTARNRFEEANKKRTELRKPPYKIDETFLSNLEKGLPPNTFGIAIGFDRLLMITEKATHISEVTY
ncbi:EF-P lysine aminoacylase GenX [bacterium]|nr:EF-P lysine aminoacylase GenX [bacterium]